MLQPPGCALVVALPNGERCRNHAYNRPTRIAETDFGWGMSWTLLIRQVLHFHGFAFS